MESSLDLPEGASNQPEEVAADIVEAGIAHGQLVVDTVPIDQHELDSAEEQIIQRFVRNSCKCDLGPNRGPCSSSITVDHFSSVRCQMAVMTSLTYLSWVK